MVKVRRRMWTCLKVDGDWFASMRWSITTEKGVFCIIHQNHRTDAKNIEEVYGVLAMEGRLHVKINDFV